MERDAFLRTGRRGRAVRGRPDLSRWTGRRWLRRRDRAVRGCPDLSRWTGRRWLWRRSRAVRGRPDLSRWTGGRRRSRAVRGCPDLSRWTGRRWLWRRSRAVRGRSDLSRWTGRRWRCGHHRSLRLHPRLPPAAVREDEHREKNDDANLSAIQRETVAGLPLVFGSVSQSGPRELPGSVSLNGCRVHLLMTSRASPLHRVRFFQFYLIIMVSWEFLQTPWAVAAPFRETCSYVRGKVHSMRWPSPGRGDTPRALGGGSETRAAQAAGERARGGGTA